MSSTVKGLHGPPRNACWTSVYQEMMLAPQLTVAENLSLVRLPRNRYGLIEWHATQRIRLETMARLGFNVDSCTGFQHDDPQSEWR